MRRAQLYTSLRPRFRQVLYARVDAIQRKLVDTRILSVREAEVFTRLIIGTDDWVVASEMFLSTKTVSTYKMRLFNKLDCHSECQLIRFAMEIDVLYDRWELEAP